MPAPPITIKMPASPPFDVGDAPAVDDLIWVWDISTNTLRKATVSQLPFGTGGGGGETTFTAVPSPFKIYNDSDNYSYDAGTNSVKITDVRLLNKTGYPVSTTQTQTEFDDILLTYTAVDPIDDTKGNVVISGFQLADDAHITITVPGDSLNSDNAAYVQLLADVEILKLIAAPLMSTALGANGAKLLWNKPASEIPPGWQECTNMRGRMPLAQDSTSLDADLSAVIGTTGGAKMHTNTIEEMVPHTHPVTIPNNGLDFGNGSTRASITQEQASATASTGGVDDGTGTFVPQPYNILNPYRIVMWIEFVGL